MARGRIVRVTFSDRIMMFGNSYKPWKDQLDEYLLLRRQANDTLTLVKVEMSFANWVSWGGLKWCQEADFQHQLNRERCQSDEPDNPNPRQYSQMVFEEDEKVLKQVRIYLALNLHKN